jgi:Cu-Zn family superoxide dismutase
MKVKNFVIPIISIVLITAGQAQIPAPTQTLAQAQVTTETQPLIVPAAVAVLHPTEGNLVEGTVYFVQMNGTVGIIADIRRLTPNSVYGFRIHEYGDCTASNAASAGEYYSPQSTKPGTPSPEDHAGDLGDIQADAEGNVRYETAVDFISVAGAEKGVLGRAVIVHAKPADLQSQSAEDAGGRLACGVIGIINPDYLAKKTKTIE